jgi:hypothetical protein
MSVSSSEVSLVSRVVAARALVERDFFRNARPSSLLQRFEEPREIGAFVVFGARGPCAGAPPLTVGKTRRE